MYDLLCNYFGSDAVEGFCILLLAVPFIGWRIAVALEGKTVRGYWKAHCRSLGRSGISIGIFCILFFAYSTQKDEQKQEQQEAVVEAFTSITEVLGAFGETILRNYLTPEEKKSRLLPVGLATNATGWVSESQCVTSQVREAWQRVPIRRAAFRQPLPFTMPVGDNSYTEVFISSSGIISFDTPKGSELNQAMPCEEAADHVYLALLWGRNDFKPRLGSKMWYGVKGDGNFVASYDTVFIDGDTNAIAKVQVEFIDNGDMILRYKDLPPCVTNAHVAGFQNLDGGWTLPTDNLHSNNAIYLKAFGPLDLTVEDSDTDDDGISDYYELYPTNNVSMTDPCDPDSDHDGLKDGWEVRHGFNPAEAGATWEDPDSDGRPNIMESYMDTDPYVADGTPDCLTTDENKASVTFTLTGSLSDNAFAVLWFDGTALPFSVSNTAWTVYFPTGALYEAHFDAPEAYTAGVAISNANRMFIFDPSGVISSSTPPVSSLRSGSFWMGYVDFSLTPLSSLVHRWDAHVLFTAEPDSPLSSLADGAFINWTATYGEVSSQTGWVTVFSPSFEDDEYASVSVADVVAYSGSSDVPETYISSTGKVDICNGHIDLSLNATPNFSPHLGETNTIVIAAAMHNCIHNVTPGEGCTFEIELMRETTSGWQHVAWLDADSGTAGRQDAFTITNGWQGTTLQWDGIASESAAQSTSPDIFTQGTQPFNRIFPAVTSGKPLPPPFYTIFTRIRKNDTIYAQASQTVYVPQVVKIQWDDGAILQFTAPITYEDGITNETLYSGCSVQTSQQAFADIPSIVQDKLQAFNTRIVGNSITVAGDYKTASITCGTNPEQAIGEVSLDDTSFLNLKTTGSAQIRMLPVSNTIWRLRFKKYDVPPQPEVWGNVDIPLGVNHIKIFVAGAVTHEIGHLFGLVSPEFMSGSTLWHNNFINAERIMNAGQYITLDWAVEEIGPRNFYPLNAQYLTFILPKE